MLPQERQMRIGELLQEGPARTLELAATFGVSVDTIRRDLALLEKQGAVRRTHGGAMLVGQPHPVEHDDSMLPAKQAIAREAVRFLGNAETVAIDIGSTARLMARALATAFPAPTITVVTNDVQTSLELGRAPNITVNLTGGKLERRIFLCGPLTQQTLDSLYFDVAFMGTSGLTSAEGLTDPIPEAALVKRAFIEKAKRVVLLCDHTKFGRRHLMKVAPLEAIDVLITDSEAPSDFLDEIRRHGIDVIVT